MEYLGRRGQAAVQRRERSLCCIFSDTERELTWFRRINGGIGLRAFWFDIVSTMVHDGSV